jgi:hypothetical protein
MIYPPPTYLAEVVTEVSASTLARIQKEYGDSTTAFAFNKKFNALIFSWNGKYDAYGGRVWGLDATGNKMLLFDQMLYGYNGVMQLNEEDDINSTKSIDFSEAIEIIIAFQYSGDEAAYLEDGTSKFEQDYFGWVAIYKHPDNQLKEIISFECA